MSETYVAVDLDSLQAALARATRADRIATVFEAGVARPRLGFADAPGTWHVAGWSPTQPCGCWSVGADGEARCRVPATSGTEAVRLWRAANPERARRHSRAASGTEQVRRWRAANPERARELSRDANRDRRAGAGWRKWAEIARRAQEEDARAVGRHDLCPACAGGLDDGWVCAECGFDARLEARG